jgi:hypothetical protein
MAKVFFPDSFLAFTEGIRETTSSAEVYRDLVADLIVRWPGLADSLEKTAVAIDGHIHQDAFLEALSQESEVFFMARIEGG